MTEALELVGRRKVSNDLRALALRLGEPEVALEMEFEVLEEAEKGVFASFSEPSYVKTGATEASLTQSDASGAIRRIHGFSVEFGTSIWYAKFLRKIGGPSGKPRGRKRVGPSLVLKFSASARQAAVRAVADRIMGRL